MEFFTGEKMFMEIKNYKNQFDSFVSDYIINPIIITSEVLDFFTYFAFKADNISDIRALFPDLLTSFKNLVYDKKQFNSYSVTFPFEISLVVFKYYWFFLRSILKEKASKISSVINDETIKKYIVCTLSMMDSNSIPFLDNAVMHYDFSSLVFNEFNFTHCHLDYCVFDCSEMNRCHFYYSDLMGTSLQHLVIYQELSFISCNLSGAIVSCWVEKKEKKNYPGDEEDTKSNLDKKIHPIFEGCNLDYVTFEEMDITETTFLSIVSMSGAKFVRTRMKLDQLIYFLHFPVTFEEIEIAIEDSDLISIPPLERNTTSCKNEIIRKINRIKKEIKTKQDIPALLDSIILSFSVSSL